MSLNLFLLYAKENFEQLLTVWLSFKHAGVVCDLEIKKKDDKILFSVTDPPVLETISKLEVHTQTVTHTHGHTCAHTGSFSVEENRWRYNSPLLAPQVKFFHWLSFICTLPPDTPYFPSLWLEGTGHQRALPPPHSSHQDTQTHTCCWTCLPVFPPLPQLLSVCL